MTFPATAADHPVRGSRTPAQATTSADVERMKRMAGNLMRPELPSGRAEAEGLREKWVSRFKQEADPSARMELVTELAQLDDPDTVKVLLTVLSAEQEVKVRRQIELMLGFLRSAPTQGARVTDALHAAYRKADAAAEKSTVLDVLSNMRTTESVGTLKQLFGETSALPADRIEISRAFFLVTPRTAGNQDGFVACANQWLKDQAASATSANIRLAAARVLAGPGQEHKEFLKSLAASEKDPAVKKFLLLASIRRPTG